MSRRQELAEHITKVTKECEHNGRFKHKFKDFKQLGKFPAPASDRIFNNEASRPVVISFFREMIIRNQELFLQIYNLNDKCILFCFVKINDEYKCFITMSGGFRDTKAFKDFELFIQKEDKLNAIQLRINFEKSKSRLEKLKKTRNELSQEIKSIEDYKFFRDNSDRLLSELKVRNALKIFSERTRLSNFSFSFARKNRSPQSNYYMAAHAELEIRHLNRNCAEKTMMLWLMKAFFKYPDMSVLAMNSTMIYNRNVPVRADSPLLLETSLHYVKDIPPCVFCQDLKNTMFFLWRACQVLGYQIQSRGEKVHAEFCKKYINDQDGYEFSKKIKYMLPSFLVAEIERDVSRAVPPRRIDLDSSEGSSFSRSLR